MTSFTALDEAFNAGALTTGPTRAVTAAAPANFQPLFTQALTPVEEPGVPATVESHGEPQIEVVQENGRVQQIVVLCRCGDRTVIECAY